MRHPWEDGERKLHNKTSQKQPLRCGSARGEAQEQEVPVKRPSCPLAGGEQNPQAWLTVLFPYVQVAEML